MFTEGQVVNKVGGKASGVLIYEVLHGGTRDRKLGSCALKSTGETFKD